jgi:anaerobic ribonucleoside-triphosphate reductase
MARKKKAKHAYRSKFEQRLGDGLDRDGVLFQYEWETFEIDLKVVGHYCGKCGSKEIRRESRYTPDFFFPNYIVEAKGRFTARDRKRVLAVIETLVENEDPRVFVMLFMRDNTLSKSSKTRYSDWCKEHGIPYAVGTFNREWFT